MPSASPPPPPDPSRATPKAGPRVPETGQGVETGPSRWAQLLEAGGAANHSALFNAAPMGIALSQNGRYLLVNRAFLALFGHDEEAEILGKPLLDHIAVEEREGVLARNRERERTGLGPMEYEIRGLRRDGTTFPMQVHVTTVQLPEGQGTLAYLSDTSKRREAEDRLRANEELFRSYVEQSTDVIFTLDAQGVFVFVSPAWERHFGFPIEEIIGRTFAPFVHPEDIQPCADYLLKVLSTGQSATSPPYRVRRADGTWRWFVANGTAMAGPGGRPQFIGVAHDITEDRRAEAALRASEEQLRIIFEASDAGIILVSPNGEIVFANRRMAELFGVSAEALLGSTYPEHLHPSERQIGDERMNQLIRGEIESVSLERHYLRADGTSFWGHLSGRRLERPDGSLHSLVGIITDITQRRDAETQQRQLQAQLHQSQKMESLGLLAGGVAHDMNNVLGAILGLASAHLEAQPPGSAVHRAFGTIIKAAERGGHMIQSLLSFARQSAAEVRAVDLNGVLREQARFLERTTLAKVRLVLELAPDLRPIGGDASDLTHAFMNLCVNAVDAMDTNGTLTLRTRNHGPEGVEVQVEDTGCGMSQEVLDRALDPFFTTKDVGKGTGLGLSMVYTTVKAHHGELAIESQPGRGTCVTLRFPAAAPSLEAGEVAVVSAPAPATPSLSVLLVDDDELIQTAMLSTLQLLGHRASLAPDGETALALVESGLRPDVVILDMNMPGLGGAGTLPRLRELCPDVPILLATGRADQTAQRLVEGHPLVTLMAKPFGLKALQAHLSSLQPR